MASSVADRPRSGTNMIKKLVMGGLGKGMWLDILEWTKNRPFVNAHQRVTSAKGGFNYQMDRVVCSVDTSLHLFPATPVIAWWAHGQTGHDGRDGG